MKKKIKPINESLSNLEDYVQELIDKDIAQGLRDGTITDTDMDMVYNEDYRIPEFLLPLGIYSSLVYTNSKGDIKPIKGKVYKYKHSYEMVVSIEEWEEYEKYLTFLKEAKKTESPMNADVFRFKKVVLLCWLR